METALRRSAIVFDTVVSAVARRSRPLEMSVLATGLAVYMILQTGIILVPMQARATPPETDDAYGYILKAVQMATCLRQDCPALVDLRQQVVGQTKNVETAWMRAREYHRAILVYHPLHSALMVTLRWLALSWEEAYETIWVTGSLLLGIATAYWLAALWGPGCAGFTMALLAFIVFEGQGVHYVVPSNLALGIAMIVWARISASDGAAQWSLSLGVLAMVTMHPVGRLYALASIVLFLLFRRGRPWGTRARLGFLFSCAIVCLSLFLPLFVHRPELQILPSSPPAHWPESWYARLGLGLWDNLQKTDEVVKAWIAPYGSPVAAVLITALGASSLSGARRSRVAKNGLMLAGLLLIGALHVLPSYPGELFQRVWVPTAALLTAATGEVTWTLLAVAASRLVRPRTQGGDSEEMPTSAGVFSTHFLKQTGIWALVLAVGALVILRVETGVVQGLRALKHASLVMRDRQPWILDAEQPALALSRARPNASIVYVDEVSMHFYLTHGALELGAIYYPALEGTSALASFAPQQMQYVVGPSPVLQLREAREAMVPMSAFSSIEYSSPLPKTAGPIRLYLVNPGREAALQLRSAADQAEATDVTVPASWSGWLNLPTEVSDKMLPGFTIQFRDAESQVYLRGIRLTDTNLYWPWDQRAVLVFRRMDHEASQAIRFDPEVFFPLKGIGRSAAVLDDNGSTVLAEVGARTANHH